MGDDLTRHLFNDVVINKVQQRLPYSFQILEIENSRNGKLGMEVGVARERVLIALLIYVFGIDNVNVNIPTNYPDIDVLVHNIPISIKTFSNQVIQNIKVSWTVDSHSAKVFYDNYAPQTGLLLVHINWGGKGYVYYFDKILQNKTLSKLGKDKYLKLPTEGTNARGIEITKLAINEMISDGSCKSIPIHWNKNSSLRFSPYDRWIDFWNS